MTVLLAITGWDIAPWEAEARAALGERTIAVHGRDKYDPAAIEIALVWKQPAGALAGLANLKAVLCLGAGVDHILADPLLPPVPIARTVDPDLTMRMTEWVVLQVLAHHRRQRLYLDQQAKRVWASPPQEAASAVRVGLLGLGELGRDAAEVLARLGFRVAGWARTARTVAGIEVFHGAAGLAPFLARTDILVALMPLTAETRGILNYGLFAGLARDGVLGAPILINAGRGGLQIEADILAALDDGTLGAATLDVFETEPLPAASPLWGHSKVTITPHVAADSGPREIMALVVRQIARIEAGLPPEHLVDPKRGY